MDGRGSVAKAARDKRAINPSGVESDVVLAAEAEALFEKVYLEYSRFIDIRHDKPEENQGN